MPEAKHPPRLVSREYLDHLDPVKRIIAQILIDDGEWIVQKDREAKR